MCLCMYLCMCLCMYLCITCIFNPKLSGLFRGLFWGGSKYVITRTYVVSENICFSTKTVLILLTSAFFRKKSAFFLAKIVPLRKPIV